MKIPVLFGRSLTAGGPLAAAIALMLTGCGGGGGGASQPPPTIQAMLFGLPGGKQPPAGFANALAIVADGVSGNLITNATVTMNGTPLAFNSAPAHQEYEGTVSE